MKKDWVLTQELFEQLLNWLDPNDREAAGLKYEAIRTRLIKIFACRGCYDAEDLADETINRVASKLNEVADTFTGDHARYFYGVALKIHLEYLRPRPVPTLPEPRTDLESTEIEYACLDHCVGKLSTENRELVLEYYQEDKRAKIEHRRHLAERLGIAINALRIRAHRVRASLHQCVEKCLQENPA